MSDKPLKPRAKLRKPEIKTVNGLPTGTPVTLADGTVKVPVKDTEGRIIGDVLKCPDGTQITNKLNADNEIAERVVETPEGVVETTTLIEGSITLPDGAVIPTRMKSITTAYPPSEEHPEGRKDVRMVVPRVHVRPKS